MIQPPDSLEANRLQAALTRRFLMPVLADLEPLFLEMRAETDRALAPNAAARSQQPYPHGYCLEITRDVINNLLSRNAALSGGASRALSAFLKHGGVASMVWGVLRGRYFQNAIQLGSLYVDVANDSVDPRKPKVEILPMELSGLELVRDVAHFARTAEAYWDVRCYANIALPALAPLFPLIVIDSARRVALQSRTGHMMRLLGSDGFRKSERWLREAPPPPPEAVNGLRQHCPADVLAASPVATVEAAIEACRALRSQAAALDMEWIEQMRAMFDRVPQIQILAPAPKAGVLIDLKRTNARFATGVDVVAA